MFGFVSSKNVGKFLERMIAQLQQTKHVVVGGGSGAGTPC